MKLILGHEIIKDNLNSYVVKDESNFQFITSKTAKKKFKYVKNLEKNIKNFSLTGKYSKIIDKKLSYYRKHLSKELNIIHKTKYNQMYWGLLIDTFLTDFLGIIISDHDSLKQIKKKYKNLTIEYQEKKFKSYNSHFFTRKENDPILQKFFLKETAKVLKLNIKKKEHNFSFYNNIIDKNYFINKFLFFFVKLFIKVFKPIFVETEYAKLKYKFFDIKLINGKLYFFSKAKLFAYNYDYDFDLSARNSLKIKKNLDYIDKIFNGLITTFFPASYLENFKKIKSDNKVILESLKSFVGTTTYRINDNIKILIADMKFEKKKKIIYFSHAPFEDLRKVSKSFNYCKQYSDKYVNFSKSIKSAFNQHKILNLKPFQFLNPKNKILIFGTVTRAFNNNNFRITKENHPHLSSDLEFYKKLDFKKKNICYVKLFPSIKESYEITKNIWKTKNPNKIKFIEKNSDFDNFHRFNLLIINEVSTPLFEVLYTKRPFILIYENSFINLKHSLKMKFLKLRKYKLLFKNSYQASQYINHNLEKYLDNWHNVIMSNEYKEIRKIVCS